MSAASSNAPPDTEAFYYFVCKCGRSWRELWPMPMLCSITAKRMRAIQCPSCGNADPMNTLEPDE